MSLEKLKFLLMQVSKTSEHYEKIAKLSGEGFNVFRTLNLESSEVQMHSAFLAEFLNPKGTHGQEDLYLRLFVEQFHISNFDTKLAFADVEKYTGAINADSTKGGRIDVLLTDGNGQHIIIENKIYAKDQRNQLVRYHDFDKQAPLFYLNLFGTEPTDWSTDGKLDETQYKIISYHTDIKKWLEKCKKESVSLPIIRETIAQYINLIKYLTNQTAGDNMKEEIKKLIIDNSDYADSIDLCSQALNSIIVETKEQFKRIFDECYPPVKISLNINISIIITWGEDGDGVYFGYQAIENNTNISGSDKVKNIVEILKELDDSFHSSNNYIGWFNPKPFSRRQRFEHLNKKEIIKMYMDTAYLKNFIGDLIKQEEEIRQSFLAKVR